MSESTVTSEDEIEVLVSLVADLHNKIEQLTEWHKISDGKRPKDREWIIVKDPGDEMPYQIAWYSASHEECWRLPERGSFGDYLMQRYEWKGIE